MIDIGKKILNMALKLGADEAEIFLVKNSGTSFSIERNSVNFASSNMSYGIGIRILKNKKIGFAFCTKEAQAEKAVKNALSSSKLGKETKFIFPEPGKTKKIENLYDKKIVEISPEEGEGFVKDIVETALDVDKNIIISSGGVGYSEEHLAIVNSKGIEIEDKGTGIGGSATAVLKKKNTATGFEILSSRMLDIDFNIVGKNAAGLAVKTLNPRKCGSKNMTVLFTPYALSSLLEFTTIPALYADKVHKGESIYSNRIGEAVSSEILTVVENGSMPNGLNSAIADDEGIPSKRTELIKNGVLKNYLYDVLTSAEYDKESTGNAVRSEKWSSSRTFKTMPSIKSRNFIINGKTEKIEKLISGVKEGILVYDAMGAHTSNPASGRFSINSSILFKIEKGEIVYPVKQVMISGNMGDCLKNVSGIGDDFRKLPGGLSTVSVIAPTVRVENVRVSI
ncbi:MAG: TldD/PmbA family protein [Thermoplasmatales archaeon]|nr:TldD/PmbA family protein [Thermoplasmatales archaeon]